MLWWRTGVGIRAWILATALPPISYALSLASKPLQTHLGLCQPRSWHRSKHVHWGQSDCVDKYKDFLSLLGPWLAHNKQRKLCQHYCKLSAALGWDWPVSTFRHFTVENKDTPVYVSVDPFVSHQKLVPEAPLH